MCIHSFIVSWCDFSPVFTFLLFNQSPLSIIYSLYSILLPLCQFSPCGSPSCSLHLDHLFSLSPPHSRLSVYALVPHHPHFPPSSSFTFHPSLSLSPLHTPPVFPFPSVFCVSRTLMVTQIFWLLAVPWGWDAVSALHLEVLYNLHPVSSSQMYCTKVTFYLLCYVYIHIWLIMLIAHCLSLYSALYGPDIHHVESKTGLIWCD